MAYRSTREASHASSDATVGGGSTPDLTRPTLEGKKSSNRKDQALSTYRPGRKRAAGSDIQPTEFAARVPIRQDNPRRAKVVGYEIAGEPYTDDLDYPRDIRYAGGLDPSKPKSSHARMFDPYYGSAAGVNPPMQLTPSPSSEWSVEANPHGHYYSTHRDNPRPIGRHLMEVQSTA